MDGNEECDPELAVMFWCTTDVAVDEIDSIIVELGPAEVAVIHSNHVAINENIILFIIQTENFRQYGMYL